MVCTRSEGVSDGKKSRSLSGEMAKEAVGEERLRKRD